MPTGKVTVTAKRLLEDAVRDSKRKTTVQIPGEFARIQDASATSTPLSRLFRRGEVPMKLYLTLLLLTRKGPPHELYRHRTDQNWANLLGLEEQTEATPGPGAGTRRVQRALRTLENGWPPDGPLIARSVERARGPVLRVMHPPGSPTPPYITIPIELWSRGWINVMSARALYVYLCLRLMFVSKAVEDPVHVSVWERQRFAMSDDTWQRGVAELERLGLIRAAVQVVTADRWSYDRRPRKVLFYDQLYLKNTDSPTNPV